MERHVTCYVVNNTGQQFYTDNTQNNVWNGHTETAPQTITSSTSTQTIFYYTKTDGSMVGATGKVFYELNNNTYLQLSFNNPYDQFLPDGYSPTYCDCFFYAGITGVSNENVPAYYVDCVVEFDGNPASTTYTSEVQSMTATITINSNS